MVMLWLVTLSVNVRINVACANGAHNAHILATSVEAATFLILFVNFIVFLLK